DDEHAGHDRLAGEMSLEMRLVERDVLDADAAVVTVHLDDAVDEKKRIAMRQELQNALNVDAFELARPGCPFRHLVSSSLGARPRAILRRTAVSRSQSRSGCAGNPAHRARAGTWRVRPARAAIWAPSPTSIWPT